MKLDALGITTKQILKALAGTPANRRKLAEQLGLPPANVSKALNRLSVFGLVERDEPNGAWRITPDGCVTLGIAPPVAPEPAPVAAELDSDEPEMATEMAAGIAADVANFDPTAWEPEPPAPPPCAPSNQIAADLLAAMEIEVALDHVRSKLRSTSIPARAQRVYREVLAVLPPALVEALAPVTGLVEMHNLQ